MEIKKSKKADLERSRLTGFLLGLAIAVSLFITALEFNSGAPGPSQADHPLDHLIKDLSIPAVDEQDQEASKPTSNLKNEILTPEKSEHTTVQKESADEIQPHTTEATEAQAGQGLQQFSTVQVADAPQETTEQPQEQAVTAPPAPLDPVEPGAKAATNLPVPPKGWAEFNKWMGENLKYPKQAEKKKIKGDVVLAFIVNPDGSISDIKLAKSGHALLNKEVLRVAHLMGKWKPGYKDHKPCKTYMELPIAFNL